MTASIDLADLDDLDQIMILENDAFGPTAWSRASWLTELGADDRVVLVARADAAPGGTVGVITVQIAADTADLLRLVVAPQLRRHGVGAALIDAAVHGARDRGAARMLLEVESDNDPAIAAYQRYGFEQLGSRPDYYGPGRHALIMKLYDLSGSRPVTVDWVPGGDPVRVDLIGGDHA